MTVSLISGFMNRIGMTYSRDYHTSCFSSSWISAVFKTASGVSVLSAIVLFFLTFSIGSSFAFIGSTRTLSLHHVHTKESLTITYKRGGVYDKEALQRLNWFLRDWRQQKQTRMDPLLFDLLWEVHNQMGSNQPIQVLSAYRSRETNNALRKRNRSAAKESQHISGKALDFYLPDVDSTRIRMLAIKMQKGGVGYYPSTRSKFIHLDVGSVRAWPRLSENQLYQLFPNGKTVHVTDKGKTLPGFELARAEILSRGGSVLGYNYSEQANTRSDNQANKGLFAALFGGDEEEDSEEIATPTKVVYSSRSNASFFLEEQQRMQTMRAARQKSQQQDKAGDSQQDTSQNDLIADLSPENIPLPPTRTLAFASLEPSNTASSLTDLLNDQPLPPQRPSSWDVAVQMSSEQEDTDDLPPIPPTRTSSLLAYAALNARNDDASRDVLETLYGAERPSTAMTTDPRNETASGSQNISSNIFSNPMETASDQSTRLKGAFISEKEPNSASFSKHRESRYVACAPVPLQKISEKIPFYRASAFLGNTPLQIPQIH